jgi:hypothetical protein
MSGGRKCPTLVFLVFNLRISLVSEEQHLAKFAHLKTPTNPQATESIM